MENTSTAIEYAPVQIAKPIILEREKFQKLLTSPRDLESLTFTQGDFETITTEVRNRNTGQIYKLLH